MRFTKTCIFHGVNDLGVISLSDSFNYLWVSEYNDVSGEETLVFILLDPSVVIDRRLKLGDVIFIECFFDGYFICDKISTLM